MIYGWAWTVHCCLASLVLAIYSDLAECMGSSKRKKEEVYGEDLSEEGPVKKRKIEDTEPLPEPAATPTPTPINTSTRLTFTLVQS